MRKTLFFSVLLRLHWCIWLHAQWWNNLKLCKIKSRTHSPIVACFSFFPLWQHGPYLFRLLSGYLFCFLFVVYIIQEKFNDFKTWIAMHKIMFEHCKFNCAIAWLLNGNGFFFNSCNDLLWVPTEICKKLIYFDMKYDHWTCLGRPESLIHLAAENAPISWQFNQ